MKRKLITVLFLFFSVGFLPQGSARAQERGLIPDRILNPLPDYDPFVERPATPQFFPDEVDKRLHQALIDGLTNRDGAIEGHVRFFKEKDAGLKKERRPVTGLAEPALDLFHSTIRDREAYLAAQKKALSSAPSPEQKKRIEARLHNDDLAQADELLRKSSVNWWGGLLNRLFSSMDLVTIVSGSYVGAAVDSAVSQLVAAGSQEMPIEERKALARYLEHLKRHPDDPQNERARKQVAELEKKKRKLLAQKQIDKAKKAEDKGDLATAMLHYEMAAVIDPLSREVEERFEQLKKRDQAEETEKRKKLSLGTERPAGNWGPVEEPELARLLYAVSLGNPAEIQAQTKAVEEKHRGEPLAESARDASAAALDMQGRHEEAKKLLKQIERAGYAPHAKERAGLLLRSPEYNLLASFDQARSNHRLQTAKYILLGEDFLKKNLLYDPAVLIAAGPAGAISIAAVNVMLVGSNLVQVLTANPISYQPVIDKGVDYIRTHPQSESATEVYRVLAEAYEGLGMYDKAIAYHEMSGKTPEKTIASLKEKAAKTLLQAADRSGDRNAREAYLKTILDHYPESGSANEATQKLSGLKKSDDQGLRISKKFLIENPELYGPDGLRLKPSLFDGNVSNMELAEQGVHLLSDGDLLFHFQTPWGMQSQIYPVERQAGERFKIMLRRKNYEVAMRDVDVREKGSPGGIKNLPLSILRGEPERRGAEPGDATLTLVQEAGGPSSSAANSELVSEKERDGAMKLPPVRGSVSSRGFDLAGALGVGPLGNRLFLGTDEKSPYGAVQLPIPLLEGFVPVDFLLQGRPGRFSLFPKIQLYEDKGEDQELYR